MGGGSRPGGSRTAANKNENAGEDVHQRILRTVYGFYKNEEAGLVKIAGELDHKLLAPRKKISVVLIGNHSAGKSSFINWYVEEHVQKTGVAIETQGFTLVTSGKKRETLKGPATLHLFPYFSAIGQLAGVESKLCTEISTSTAKNFPLATFIDTPGLVDGKMQYTFDVDKAVMWLGEQADLVFVFFDPIGQALCDRTMNVIEALNKTCGQKLHFFLSKADSIDDESDRQKVIVQITQNLTQRIGNRQFDLPTIFIPAKEPGKTAKVKNNIQDACKLVDETIKQTVQNTLDTLEDDCKTIAGLIDARIAKSDAHWRRNVKGRLQAVVLFMLGALLPLLLLAHVIVVVFKDAMVKNLEPSATEFVFALSDVVTALSDALPMASMYKAGLAVLLPLVLLYVAMLRWSPLPTLTGRERRVWGDRKVLVQSTLIAHKKQLYQDYFKECVGDRDLD